MLAIIIIFTVFEFDKYKEFIRRYSFTNSQDDNISRRNLLLQEQSKLLVDVDEKKGIYIYYAPFDYINLEAKIVICGMTPGYSQYCNALLKNHDLLQSGENNDIEILRQAKETASFSGDMRQYLIDMLDYVDINGKFEIKSCKQLFPTSGEPKTQYGHYVHFTSALFYPVYIKKGENYNNYTGSPKILKHDLLKRYISRFLIKEIEALPNATWIPLGSEVNKVFVYLEHINKINPNLVLHDFPHPSGSACGPRAYFLGKQITQFSPKYAIKYANASKNIIEKYRATVIIKL